MGQQLIWAGAGPLPSHFEPLVENRMPHAAAKDVVVVRGFLHGGQSSAYTFPEVCVLFMQREFK